ncbi:MAG TPA: cytochrome b [Rhodocyclaceae bacterium]
MEQLRHSKPTIALHWLHALLIIGLLALGWYMADLPKGPERSNLIGLHKSFGIVALALIFLRAGWKFTQPALPPAPGKPWEQTLAKAAHHLLYLLMLLVPVAGFLSSSFTKYPMKFFGIELPRLFLPNEGINDLFHELHEASATVLAVVIGLHLLGVAVHKVRGEDVMPRMGIGR